jgi:glycosyltransferase involved in cell wall biosynthesis
LSLERSVAQTADWVAATCTDEVFELARLGRPRSRISVIPCGVDLNRFRPGDACAPRGPLRRIVSVGRLVPRKGFDILIRAMTAIPDAELLIIGGPEASSLSADPEARRLTALAAGLGVAERVRLCGSVSRAEMPGLLRSADVVACTPWYEPFGIVPVEAMACGVPVLAAAVGGMLDTVVDGMTGLLVPPRCPQRIAEAVAELLDDPARRAAMGSAAAERARMYRWDRVGASTLDVYRGVLSLAPIPITWPGQLAAAAR